MSDRDMSASMLTEIAKDEITTAYLIKIIFDDATFYLTDFGGDLVWGGDTYTATGKLLNFSHIEENATPIVTTVSVSLSGIDQTYISQFLSYDYIDRQLLIYKAMIDSTTGVIVSSPVNIFDGRMDRPVIQENPDDGTCTIAIQVTNHFVDFNRKPGRHTNNEEQQIFFPGDLGFEYSTEIVRDIIWGRK